MVEVEISYGFPYTGLKQEEISFLHPNELQAEKFLRAQGFWGPGEKKVWIRPTELSHDTAVIKPYKRK